MLRLGLDLGTNSIGWCVFNGHDASHVIDAGVRIFSDGRNPKDKKPLNEVRRTMRGMRRNRDRGQGRFRNILNILKKYNILTEENKQSVFSLNPYESRCLSFEGGADNLHLARAILHFGKRRGFQSNRKTDGDSGKIQKGIDALKENLGNKSLGQYLYDKMAKEGEKFPKKIRFTGDIESKFYPVRDMYKNEFEQIRQNYSGKFGLDNKAWDEIHHALFYQRPLKPQEKGKCIFFKDEERIYKADPLFQEYRLWQDLQNLEYASVKEYKGFKPCDSKQVRAIYERAKEVKELSFSAIKGMKYANKVPLFLEEITFNLEKSKADKLKGLATDTAFSNEKAFGKAWFELTNMQKTEIVIRSLDTDTDEAFIEFLMSEHDLSLEQAKYCAKISLEGGVASVSAKFIEKILPYLYEMRYDKAVTHVMDDNGNPLHHSVVYKGEKAEFLPYYGKILEGQTVQRHSTANPELEPEKYYGKLTNVSVHVALNQLRKIVNNVINEYGEIDEIILEVARDLKKSQKEISRIESENKKNQKDNERIDKDLIAMGIPNPSREDRIKYKLWEELNKENPDFRKCIFTGRTISQDDFLYKTDIEHILPLSKTFDDSYGNKTIAFRDANHAKGGNAPFEAFGHIKTGEYSYEGILQRAFDILPDFKKWRFEEGAMKKFHNDENLSDEELNKLGLKKKDMGFIARQLTDTAYICKASKQYLAAICEPNKIWVTPGRLTSMLRHHWGLNRLIGADDMKDRSDHRHHMIDAFVIGKTTRGLIQQVSTLTGISEAAGKSRVKFPELSDQLFNDFKEIFENTLTSYKPDHGHGGSFFQETAYGQIKAPELGKNDYILVTRKKITSLSQKEIFAIRDKHIRETLLAELSQSFNVKLSEEKLKLDEKKYVQFLADFGEKHKIKSLRILVSKGNAKIIYHGKNKEHHKAYMLDGFAFCDIYAVQTEKGKTEYKGHFVPVIDARQIDNDKAHNHKLCDDFKQSLDRVKYKTATAKKLMRLYKNDVVSLVQDGEILHYKVFGLNNASNRLDLGPVNLSSEHQKRFSLSTLIKNQLKPVKLSPLGKERRYGTNADSRNQSRRATA